MTGAPKPTPTQPKEKREFLYRKRSCTNKSLSALRAHTRDTRKDYSELKVWDNKSRAVLLRAESKGKQANLYLDQGGRHAKKGAAVKQLRSRLA